jgi:hypothetical protein
VDLRRQEPQEIAFLSPKFSVGWRGAAQGRTF